MIPFVFLLALFLFAGVGWSPEARECLLWSEACSFATDGKNVEFYNCDADAVSP